MARPPARVCGVVVVTLNNNNNNHHNNIHTAIVATVFGKGSVVGWGEGGQGDGKAAKWWRRNTWKSPPPINRE